jgi:hypothetical protein
MSMRLPAAIQKQIEEGERQFRELQQSLQAQQPASQPEPQPQPQPVPLETPPPEPSTDQPSGEPSTDQPSGEPEGEPPPAQADAGPGDPWEARYKTLQGKFNKEVKQQKDRVRELEERLRANEALLRDLAVARAQAAPTDAKSAEPAKSPAKPKRYVSDQEVAEYGEDLVDLIGRRAREVAEELVGGKLVELDELKSRYQTLTQDLGSLSQDAQAARRARLESVLDSRVPGWRETNDDPLFHDWLAQPDVYSGQPRQHLLNDAVGSADYDRVARIFLGYRSEQQATAPAGAARTPTQGKLRLDTLAAPARARSVPAREPAPEKPMTEGEIAQFNEDVLKGRYRGREAEMRAMDERINRALLAGLIQVQPRY